MTALLDRELRGLGLPVMAARQGQLEDFEQPAEFAELMRRILAETFPPQAE